MLAEVSCVDELQKAFDDSLALYQTGDNENRKKAKETFLELVEYFDDFGEMYSKCYYYAGKCAEGVKDYADAKKYYEKALNSAEIFAEAYKDLGRIFYFGYGIEADKVKAYNLFCQGLNLGLEDCYYYIGLCHKYKRIDNASDDEAFKCFSLHFEKNKSSHCASQLSYCYSDGIGTEIDLNKALEVLDRYPNKLDFYSRAGNILSQLGRFDEARKRFNKLLNSKNADKNQKSEAQNALNRINNVDEPNAIMKAVSDCGDDFSEIEAIIKSFSGCNAEKIYDYALDAESQGLTFLAIKLFIISAAAGCKKAGYTLANMAAEDTKYFTEIIEGGAI